MIKATIFLITALVNIAIGAALFFMLIISLNGFTGKQAEPGLILFIVWAVIASIMMGVLALLTAIFLIERKSFNPWLTASLAIGIFIIVGAAIDFVGLVAAVVLTSAMR
jgi:hypothetical protein